MKINTLKIGLLAKVVTTKIEGKTIIIPQSKNNNQKSTITMTTALMFQHMKITFMLLSAQETLAKHTTCSKC